VPNVTDINCDVPVAHAVTADPWHARPGVSSLRSAFPGTGLLGVGVPGAGCGTGPSALVRPVPRARDKAALVVPAPQAVAMAQLGQTNNYMTSVFVIGEGAAGPPPDREPA
jgi:hypothetical protein